MEDIIAEDPKIIDLARGLRNWLQSRSIDMVTMLRELVLIESHASQPAGVNQTGDLVSAK
jgi:hypothetical protein